MTERAYTIAPDGKSITCHVCGRTSHNQMDVANVYCGHCHCFHEVGLDPRRNTVDELANCFADKLGNRAFVLIVLEPGENPQGEAGSHVNAATNLRPDAIPDLLLAFHTQITNRKPNDPQRSPQS